VSAEPAFLGRGWAFPPAFTAGGAELVMASGSEDIVQSLQILLGTELGERLMQEDYGSSMQSVLFEEMDQGLINRLNSLVSNAILYHEPRIKLDHLGVSEDEKKPGMLFISIEYTIRSTNSRYNMVYPFYLNEAVNPGSS